MLGFLYFWSFWSFFLYNKFKKSSIKNTKHLLNNLYYDNSLIMTMPLVLVNQLSTYLFIKLLEPRLMIPILECSWFFWSSLKLTIGTLFIIIISCYNNYIWYLHLNEKLRFNDLQVNIHNELIYVYTNPIEFVFVNLIPIFSVMYMFNFDYYLSSFFAIIVNYVIVNNM
jgi:hypothetical protein